MTVAAMRFALLARQQDSSTLASMRAELALFDIEVVSIRHRPPARGGGELIASVADEVLDELMMCGPWDGVLLACDGGESGVDPDDDGAGLATRIRRVLGPNIPVATVNDAHANAARQLLDSLTVLWAMRTLAVDPPARPDAG